MERLDLNLMVVFDTIMVERNLRRTAERLGRTQPAISQAVARLRDVCGDQLFQRTPQGVEPTPRAEALWAEVREPLAIIRAQMAPQAFEPQAATGELRLGLSEDVQALAMALIISDLRAQAPQLVVRVLDTDHMALWSHVRSGYLDFGVSVAGPAPRGLAGQLLDTHGFSMVHRSDSAPPTSFKAYLAATHVAVGFGDGEPGFTDQHLEERGAARTVIAWTPRFMSIPDLVMRTGAIATMPTPFAKFCAKRGGVSVARAPFALPDITVRMGWHMRRHSHPLHAWLRARVAHVVKGELSADA